MLYREVTPNPPFDQFIQCYWVLESSLMAFGNKELILPDGQMEVIFHYGDPYCCINIQGDNEQPRSFVFGQLERSIELYPTGSSGIFGVRFTTSGAGSFIDIPLSELKNYLYPAQ